MPSMVIRDEVQRERALFLLQNLDITKPKVIEWSDYRKPRSISQNKLYHKWVDILGDHFGYEKEEMKEELMIAFLPAEGRVVKNGLDGSEREFLTTTKLKTDSMSAYLDAIDRFAIQNGVNLPHPQDLQKNW